MSDETAPDRAPSGDPAGEAARFDEAAAGVADRDAYERLRLEWLGRKKGRVRSLLAALRDQPPEKRREFGQAVNELKTKVEERLAEIDRRLAEEEAGAARREAAVDVTLPGRRPELGTLHPVSRVGQEIVEIFARLGYSVAEGPEVEEDRYNFQLLNFPLDHPARDTQDTFFVAGPEEETPRVLRTHTSPVQIRTMLARKPPIRVVTMGRCYRHDNDLRHSPMFHQIECLAVAEGLTMGHLKGTLETFIHELFGPDIGVRLRPSHFPFTEPSAEVDITCPFCRGGGCRVCSSSGWMEILGSGMVDPRVLDGVGIDPDRYSGYAFGLGIDRVAMIRYGIGNIRMLFENDQRLLAQVTG